MIDPRATGPGFFVAGTDTGVGKTRVTTGLLAAARGAGWHVAGMKPVAAGLIDANGIKINEDVAEIWAATDQADALRDVNPYALELPVSPHIAAKMANIEIDIATISASAARLALGRDLLLVEGAGGWHAPISASRTMADVATALGLPVLLVVGLKLGCLNHARLTREAIRATGLPFAGWLGSEIDPSMPEQAENRLYLEAMFGEKPLGWLPHAADPASDAAHLAPAVQRLLKNSARS